VAESPATRTRGPRLGPGQIALEAAQPIVDAPDQVRASYRFSDPALSELSLDGLLDELLNRTQEALDVDTVAILLLDEEAQQLVARAAKGVEEEVERGVRIPIGRGFAGRIAGERVAIFIADVDHADILNPILREKGIHSLLGVPLIVEGHLIGVMHVGSLHPRQFGQNDVAILQLAAARAAPAIERASLAARLEHEHSVSTALQRSLLPKRLGSFVGATLAARYLPAREEVGGDWYDVIELPRGRVGLVIGDVVGHGVPAASLMGRLRTALHSYAIESHGPGRTLELVDRFVQSLNEPAMATAAYAVFDPYASTVQYAAAGHLPPVVITRSGTRVIDVTPAPPLGAFPYGRCAEHEFALEREDILFLYTDGPARGHLDGVCRGRFIGADAVLDTEHGLDLSLNLGPISIGLGDDLNRLSGVFGHVEMGPVEQDRVPAGLQADADPPAVRAVVEVRETGIGTSSARARHIV
jgi:phosphoserine phosphatase RsbU/P